MAEPKAKKKQFTRKKKVIFDRVRFTVPEIFGEDEEFDLPTMRQMPLGIERTMRTEPDKFFAWVIEHSTDEEAEAIDSLVGDESMIFMDAWKKASGPASGKSKR
ncbi:hypothetical protein [Brachybacterium massiliense]|uniref:hypothetical protein n=1 Tax=Brachybacterium massiliense TaxID=1755098 RepID=UPI000B3BAE53|nr:hypothetical protein [Brachybacterium massiliense]